MCLFNVHIMCSRASRPNAKIKVICVKGLRLLFTDNARHRKDMQSYMTEKLGSRKPGGK